MNLVKQFNELPQEDRVEWATKAAIGLEITPGFIGILVYEADDTVICFKVDPEGNICDALALRGDDCLAVLKEIDQAIYQRMKAGLN